MSERYIIKKRSSTEKYTGKGRRTTAVLVSRVFKRRTDIMQIEHLSSWACQSLTNLRISDLKAWITSITTRNFLFKYPRSEYPFLEYFSCARVGNMILAKLSGLSCSSLKLCVPSSLHHILIFMFFFFIFLLTLHFVASITTNGRTNILIVKIVDYLIAFIRSTTPQKSV